VLGRTRRQDRHDPALGVLDVLLDEADREDLLLLVGPPAGRGGDAGMEERVVLFEDGRVLRDGCVVDLAADAEVLLQIIDGRCACQ
jgi:hypothetical protein